MDVSFFRFRSLLQGSASKSPWPAIQGTHQAYFTVELISLSLVCLFLPRHMLFVGLPLLFFFFLATLNNKHVLSHRFPEEEFQVQLNRVQLRILQNCAYVCDWVLWDVRSLPGSQYWWNSSPCRYRTHRSLLVQSHQERLSNLQTLFCLSANTFRFKETVRVCEMTQQVKMLASKPGVPS